MKRKKGPLSRLIAKLVKIAARLFAAVRGRKTRTGSGEIDHVRLFLAFRSRKKD